MKRDLIVAVLCTFCLSVALFMLLPTMSSPGVGDYDPWVDINGDGFIDGLDIIQAAAAFGSFGTPITKASLEFDSGWIDITDKCGQYFNITHNMNSTDIIVDMQGKATVNGGVHQRNLGGTSYAQGWNKTYGGTDLDYARSVVQTSDGGYAVAGSTLSFGAGDADFWLVKTDAAGNLQWNKTYGGTEYDYASSVVQTVDGGYALAGRTDSFGAYDFWPVKTDAAGNMQWNKAYGGINSDYASSVIQTVDGGYAVTGFTESFGAGGADFWLVRTDSFGNAHESWLFGLVWTDSTADTITLYRGAADACWNFVRVRIWKIKE